MSLAIKSSRLGTSVTPYAYGMGDPGLFGFLGKAIGGIAKVGLGAVTGLATGGLTGALGGALRGAGIIKDPRQAVMSTGGGPMISNLPVLRAQLPAAPPGFPGSGTLARPMLPPGSMPGIGGAGSWQGSGSTGPLVGTASGTPCAAGYHRNKHGYFTKRYGYIEKGTVCVKNRKRNPLNPRALSRGMARLKSARKAVRALKLIDAPRGRGAARPAARRRGCGCK